MNKNDDSYPQEPNIFLYPVVPFGERRLEWRNTMKSLALKLRRFLVSEDGPTAVEYAVMLALIVIVCLTAISSLGTKASTEFSNICRLVKITHLFKRQA